MAGGTAERRREAGRFTERGVLLKGAPYRVGGRQIEGKPGQRKRRSARPLTADRGGPCPSILSFISSFSKHLFSALVWILGTRRSVRTPPHLLPHPSLMRESDGDQILTHPT